MKRHLFILVSAITLLFSSCAFFVYDNDDDDHDEDDDSVTVIFHQSPVGPN